MSNFWNQPLQWKSHDADKFEKAHDRQFNCPECGSKPKLRAVLHINAGYGGQTWKFRFRCDDGHEWVDSVYMWTD